MDGLGRFLGMSLKVKRKAEPYPCSWERRQLMVFIICFYQLYSYKFVMLLSQALLRNMLAAKAYFKIKITILFSRFEDKY